jgi:hypothetical protein
MKQNRVAQVATILALVVALLAPAAIAAKGGGGKGHPGWDDDSSLALVVLESIDGLPHYGQQVTFNVSTTATSRPYVQLSCFQGGTLVAAGSAGFYDDYPWPWERNFTLSSNSWTGGAADCVAELTYWNGRRWNTLTSLSFDVYA